MTDSILFLGATGFVGGDVLHKLLTSSSSNVGHIIIPTSSASKQKKVQAWLDGLQTRIATSLPIIEREPASKWYSECQSLSSEVDCVVQLATSDDLDLTKAINAGLVRAKEGGKKGVLIHASGVQLIESAPVGKYVDTPNYDDYDRDSIASIPDSAAHRGIDLEIESHFESGRLCGAIICPALVWGKGAGPDKVVSIMVPDTVQKSLHNQRATYTGEGTNTWVHVNIDDCANLILQLIQSNLAKPFSKKPARFDNFYFASHTSLVSFKHIAEVAGKTLLEVGKVSSAEPITVPVPAFDAKMKGVRVEDDSRSKADAEIDARTPLWPCRTNCRCQARRGAKELGWKAEKEYTDEAIRQDVLTSLESM